MLVVKDFEKLKDYGFEHNDDWGFGLYYDYDCGDNRTYVVVDDKGIVTVVPSLYGDCPAEKYNNQLDIIVKLALDGVIELKFKEPYSEEKK